MNDLLALLLLGLLVFVTPDQPPASQPGVRFVVQVPQDHAGGPVYMASSANGWEPAHPDWRLRPAGELHPGMLLIEIPLSAVAEEGFAFKFTRGSWTTVEVDEQLRDIPNRRLRLGDLRRDPQSDQLISRCAVGAFADDRAVEKRASTVVGRLDIFEFESITLANTRSIRVWVPERYGEGGDERFPVLYMHDGQNCFDAATSSFGSEWRIDETLTQLIQAGEVPPTIVVGIDNAGPHRSYEYNPSYSEFGERPSYGERYIEMLVDELMPEIERRYRVLVGPEHTSLGGSSFGGNITMLAAMERQGVFGRLLIESPAVPVIGPRFLKEIAAFGQRGRWTPRSESFTGRVFLGMGTQETDREEYNARLVSLMDELREAFAPDHHLIVVEEGASHNEQDWARRFPDAMRYLHPKVPGS